MRQHVPPRRGRHHWRRRSPRFQCPWRSPEAPWRRHRPQPPCGRSDRRRSRDQSRSCGSNRRRRSPHIDIGVTTLGQHATCDTVAHHGDIALNVHIQVLAANGEDAGGVLSALHGQVTADIDAVIIPIGLLKRVYTRRIRGRRDDGHVTAHAGAQRPVGTRRIPWRCPSWSRHRRRRPHICFRATDELPEIAVAKPAMAIAVALPPT